MATLTLDQILAEIKKLEINMDSRFTKIDDRLAGIDDRFAGVDKRLSVVETDLKEVKRITRAIYDQTGNLTERVVTLEQTTLRKPTA